MEHQYCSLGLLQNNASVLNRCHLNPNKPSAPPQTLEQNSPWGARRNGALLYVFCFLASFVELGLNSEPCMCSAVSPAVPVLGIRAGVLELCVGIPLLCFRATMTATALIPMPSIGINTVKSHSAFLLWVALFVYHVTLTRNCSYNMLLYVEMREFGRVWIK